MGYHCRDFKMPDAYKLRLPPVEPLLIKPVWEPDILHGDTLRLVVRPAQIEREGPEVKPV